VLVETGAVMCVNGDNFASVSTILYIGIWNCFDSLVCFGFHCIAELFRQFGMFCFSLYC
jgi:hypothetical protein